MTREAVRIVDRHVNQTNQSTGAHLVLLLPLLGLAGDGLGRDDALGRRARLLEDLVGDVGGDDEGHEHEARDEVEARVDGRVRLGVADRAREEAVRRLCA